MPPSSALPDLRGAGPRAAITLSDLQTCHPGESQRPSSNASAAAMGKGPGISRPTHQRVFSESLKKLSASAARCFKHVPSGGLSTSFGNSAFVTFRYAADAKRALHAFRRRPFPCRPCNNPPRQWFASQLEVSRAPEVSVHMPTGSHSLDATPANAHANADPD